MEDTNGKIEVRRIEGSANISIMQNESEVIFVNVENLGALALEIKKHLEPLELHKLSLTLASL